MAVNGTCIKKDFVIIRNNPDSPVTVMGFAENHDCCFDLPVFAETIFTSNLNNDKSAFIYFYSEAFTNAQLYLQKYINGAFQDVDELTNDDYGINYSYGFYNTLYSEKSIGYQIDWRKVLLNEGEGDYRIKAKGTQLIGSPVIKIHPFEFCLKEFKSDLADKTVRLEWWKNGNTGSLEDDSKKWDYGTLDWYNQFRLPNAYFGDDTSPNADREYVRYQNGAQVWLKDSLIEEYTLRIAPLPNYVHRFLKFDFLISGEKLITDYNLNNATTHIQKKVISSSGYEPKWTTGTLFAPLELKFAQAHQNFNAKRS